MPEAEPDDRRDCSDAGGMIREQIVARGVRDPRVLDAMARVRREVFLPAEVRDKAYTDRPQPIGSGQTISQPYMVACMTELLHLRPRDRVLEIGTGSGYQAAILASLAAEVVSIERHEGLARSAAAALKGLGFHNVEIHVSDGTLGWPARAPYDRIIVTAAAPEVPPALVEQLADGGRLVCPVGPRDLQDLIVITRNGDQLQREQQTRCIFVPLVGVAGWDE